MDDEVVVPPEVLAWIRKNVAYKAQEDEHADPYNVGYEDALTTVLYKLGVKVSVK